MGYKVIVEDHGHYQDRDHRSLAGDFDTADEAVAECRRIVRASLKSLSESGQTGEELFQLYMLYGDDPYVLVGEGLDPASFSAMEFARTYSARLQRRRVVGRASLLLGVVIVLGLLLVRGWP